MEYPAPSDRQEFVKELYAAYELYSERNADAVKARYPQHFSFATSLQDMKYSDVKKAINDCADKLEIMRHSHSNTLGEAKSQMTFAFMLFMEKGLEAVKGVYPQHYDFVVSHKGNTLSEVRKAINDILFA